MGIPYPKTDVIKSDVQTATALVRTGAAHLYGINLTAGADAASATLHNSVDNSGDILVSVKAAINTTRPVMFPNPVNASTGLYLVITGTTPVCNVYFTAAS